MLSNIIPHRLTAASWACRGALRLPTPAPSLANGSTLAAPQPPATTSPAEAAVSAPALDAPSAAGKTNGTLEAAEEVQKTATPDSVMAELVALLAHKDNKASDRPFCMPLDCLRTSPRSFIHQYDCSVKHVPAAEHELDPARNPTCRGLNQTQTGYL